MASKKKRPAMKHIHSLSLLSRGNGQVVQSKQKRLEVYLEPEDYLNWICQDKALIGRSQDGAQTTGGSLPKTYSTRKGILILYSEDFAEPTWKQKQRKKDSCPFSCRRKKSSFALHTLQDLMAAILAFESEGKVKDQGCQPYLHFLSKPDSQTEQQIHPGYSAKRYLLSLFQNWAPGSLYKLQCSGYIRDPRLFQDNQLYLPNHIRRKQDLSAEPSKYHLLSVYPPVSTFWTQKEQLADKVLTICHTDESDGDNEESEDSDVEKEDDRAKKQRKNKVPLPTLRRKPSERADCLDDEVYSEDTWIETQQDAKALKKSLEHPPKGSDSMFANAETSHPSQRSHNTFYGGTSSDKKINLSGNVKISKCRQQMFPELPVEQYALPPVQLTIDPEQDGPRKVKMKKLPKAVKLPPITEELAKSPDPPKTLNDYSIPEELLILPLDIRLYAEQQHKEKGQKGVSWNTEYRPKSNVDGRPLKPRISLNKDCYSQPPLTLHHSSDSGRNSPLIPGNDFSHPQAVIHEISSEIKSSKIELKISGAGSPKDLMDDGISQSNLPEELIGNDFSHPQAVIHEIRSSEIKSSKTELKISGAGRPKALMDDGISQSNLPEELIGSSQDPALGNILMGPAGDIVCQPLLGSLQRKDLPLQFDFASGEASQFVDSSTNLCEGYSNDQHVKEANQPIDSSINLHEGYSSDQHIRKETIHSETSLHVKTCETSSLTPEPAEKGVPQSLEAAVLKTGKSQSFINKELENKKEEEEYQRRQSRTITEKHQHDLGNEGIGLKIKTQTAESYSDSDVFLEYQSLAQDKYVPLHLEPPEESSVTEKEKSKPQVDESSTKEVEKQKDGTSESLGTSELEQNLTPWAESINELGQDNEPLHHLTRPLGNAPVPPKMAGTKRSSTEKQPLSRSRKGKDVSPKLGKLVAEKRSPEKQMPEKNKRGKRNEANKLKAAPNVGKGEKPQNKTEFAEGKPKKLKIENKTSVSKKKKPRTKRKEVEKKESTLLMVSEPNNTLSENTSDEEGSLSSYSSQDYIRPSKYQTPESQMSRDERLHSLQPINVKENQSSEDKSTDASEALLVEQKQEKVPRERILAERAEMRLQEVERRRREKEEKKRQQQEEQQKLEKIKEELEQEKQRKTEEKRLQKQRLEEEQKQQEEQERKRLQQQQAAQARVRQQQEEFRKKMQEIQRKKKEEARRAEEEKQRQKELEKQLEEEQHRLMEMAKEERLEYQRRKEEEEEKARWEAEAERQKEEEKSRLALEEAMKISKQLEREKAALKAKAHFTQELLKEANELRHIQRLTRPWVYSYFQLLQISGSETIIKEK